MEDRREGGGGYRGQRVLRGADKFVTPWHKKKEEEPQAGD